MKYTKPEITITNFDVEDAIMVSSVQPQTLGYGVDGKGVNLGNGKADSFYLN